MSSFQTLKDLIPLCVRFGLDGEVAKDLEKAVNASHYYFRYWWVEHHFIEQSRTSFFEHRTNSNVDLLVNEFKHPIFRLRTIEHRTPNLIGLSLDLQNYSSNWLEHHFTNSEWSRTCSSIENRTRTPYFRIRTIKYRTSNIVRPITKINWSSLIISNLQRIRTIIKQFNAIVQNY